MSKSGYQVFPGYKSNPPTNSKPKNNISYYLTLTLLTFLFSGTLFILIASILELIDQEQKAVRLKVRRKISPRRRHRRRKIKKSSYSNTLDRLLVESHNQLSAVKEDFDNYQNTELNEQLRNTNYKTALLLLVITGGFIRVIAYATEIILFLQGSGALVGSIAENGNTFTIP